MPRLEYFVVAESISVDQSTNRISVFNVLEEATLTVPGTIHNLVAVSGWNLSEEDGGKDFQAMLRIKQAGDSEEADTIEFPVNFKAERARHRVCFFVTGLPVRQPGDLGFELLLNGRQVATHTVAVHKHEEVPAGL